MTTSITNPGRMVNLASAKPATSRTEGYRYVVILGTHYATLPEEELRARIAKASLANAQLDRLVDQLDASWKDQWLNEPDPFTPE